MKRAAGSVKCVAIALLSVFMVFLLICSAFAPVLSVFSFTFARAEEVVSVDDSDGSKDCAACILKNVDIYAYD